MRPKRPRRGFAAPRLSYRDSSHEKSQAQAGTWPPDRLFGSSVNSGAAGGARHGIDRGDLLLEPSSPPQQTNLGESMTPGKIRRRQSAAPPLVDDLPTLSLAPPLLPCDMVQTHPWTVAESRPPPPYMLAAPRRDAFGLKA